VKDATMTTKTNTQPAAEADTGPQWREEWLPLAKIICHDKLQVRRKLDAGAVRRYADMTKAGKVPPPIKVGRTPAGLLFLVDGWHRIEAGALQRISTFGNEGDEVCALVAELSEAEVRWEAAKANMDHGVPLKLGEYRNVFQAFIKAGKHKGPRGQHLSYRDMSEAIGKGHTTLRNWMMLDFPAIARNMGGTENGNPDAEQPPLLVFSLAEEQCAAAVEAARNALAALPGMTAHLRHELAQQWRAVIDEANRLGVEAPPAEAF
jgi:hypothetical protein